MQRKLAFAFCIAALALFVLVLVIIRIILTRGDDYQKKVMNQQNYSSTVLPFKRGTIMDRNQTILAASEQVYNLILDPSVILEGNQDDVDATVDAVAEAFGFTKDEIRSAIEENAKSAYVRYQKGLPEEQKTLFETLQEEHNRDKEARGKISGVWFESEYRRVYPYDSLACTALGFSGSDSRKGNWGIEQYYNDYLVGTDGRQFGYLNSDGVVERTTKPARNGNTIITTLDYTVQKIVENAIAEFCEDVETDHVGVLVMDPSNAEILAMATDSVYDLNNPNDLSLSYTEAEIEAMTSESRADSLNQMWRNFCVAEAFEPGSTTKLFTEAAVLEENLANENSTYVCDRGEQVVDRFIRCAHLHGNINLAQALAFSCNDVMMQLGKIMGKNVFSEYQSQFGLGRQTGVDLPGESSGILHSVDNMDPVDLATNTFGQNFNATMIQVAAAYCSVLNGGAYYRPHIVKEILSETGEVLKTTENTVVRETVSTSTAEILLEGLALGVNDPEGTGQLAKVNGYSVGGKTGTAEKYPRNKNKYIHSFVGCVPAENPELLIYVVIDNPQKGSGKPKIYKPEKSKYTVSETAVPLEKKIMASLVEYLNITPDPDAVAATAGAEEADGQKAAASESGESDGTTEEEEIIEPTNAGNEWEDEIPEGGFMDQDSGPPTQAETESEEVRMETEVAEE